MKGHKIFICGVILFLYFVTIYPIFDHLTHKEYTVIQITTGIGNVMISLMVFYYSKRGVI